MDVTPSKRSIDIPMGEGYRTAETDLEDANKAAEKEMAEGLEETESALSIFKRKSRTKKETPAEEETTEPVIAEETPVESVAEEKPEEKPEEPTYKFPPLSLLKEFKPTKGGATDAKTLQQTADKIVRTLQEYRIETRVTDIVVGATVVRYELEPAAGVRVRRIAELADDISLRLATESVRIEAPIPGKSAVGIEVKKPSSNIIGLRELLEDQEILNSKSKLMVALGKDVSGNLVKVDIAEMPHLLVAGTTGSGKSVCTNSMILSIL
ncbi:MAG: DNA translocase FtsK, partial [Clostridia bacterium]|nr:DNA translocase FtsK [Clostridia bacterium]